MLGVRKNHTHTQNPINLTLNVDLDPYISRNLILNLYIDIEIDRLRYI